MPDFWRNASTAKKTRISTAINTWGMRRCVQGDYLIFYRVRSDAVEIVRILHGAMDYESLLFPAE